MRMAGAVSVEAVAELLVRTAPLTSLKSAKVGLVPPRSSVAPFLPSTVTALPEGMAPSAPRTSVAPVP